jgi:hypothetical protein
MTGKNSYCKAIYKSTVNTSNQASPSISLNTSDPRNKVHFQEVMVP